MTSERTKYRQKAKLIEEGKVIRLKRGLFMKPEELEGIEGDFYKATLLCGKPSAICLGSALQYYDLSERLTGKIQILIPYETTPPRSKSIKAIRSRNPEWNIGIIKKGKFAITSIERTIIDLFRYPKHFAISEAISVLKKALKEKKTSKNDIYNMAKKLDALKKLLPYLEAV